jgi:hypothetical protein
VEGTFWVLSNWLCKGKGHFQAQFISMLEWDRGGLALPMRCDALGLLIDRRVIPGYSVLVFYIGIKKEKHGQSQKSSGFKKPRCNTIEQRSITRSSVS